MAKTWKFWPSMFRTQQGISAVWPSQGSYERDCGYVASRVWPAGNCSSPPSESQSHILGLSSARSTGDKKYRTIGTARIAPTMPLKHSPSLTSTARREGLRVDSVMELPRRGAGLGRVECAGREIVAAAPPARPPRRRFPAPTWVCRARCCASPAHPVRARPTITIVRSF